MWFVKAFFAALFCTVLASGASVDAQQLTPHRLTLAKGKTLTLNLPSNFTISIAAQGSLRDTARQDAALRHRRQLMQRL
jgi:hypothetical protein